MPADPSRHHGRTVLVGSTLGPESDDVVRAGLALARHAGGRVLLLHVLEPRREVAAGLLGFAMVRDGLEAAGRELLCAQLRRLGAAAAEVADVAVALPPVAPALLGAAERSDAHAVVIGSSRETRRESPSGSVPLELLRRCPRPLWLVGGEGPIAPAVVVALVDFGPRWSAALPRSLQALAGFVPLTTSEVVALGLLVGDEPLDPEAAQRDLDRLLARQAGRFGCRLRGIVRRGSPVEVVVAAVASEGADLLLLAGGARSGARREPDPLLPLLAHEIGCAVLLVPSEDCAGGTVAMSPGRRGEAR